jgi:hypothetical protein
VNQSKDKGESSEKKQQSGGKHGRPDQKDSNADQQSKGEYAG